MSSRKTIQFRLLLPLFVLFFSINKIYSACPIHTDSVPAASITLTDFSIENYQDGHFHLSTNKQTGNAKIILGQTDTLSIFFKEGKACLPFNYEQDQLLFLKPAAGSLKLFHLSQGIERSFRVKQIPLWLSIFPPLLAILLALVFREAILSLFSGILTGVFIANGLRFDFHSILNVIWTTIDHYLMAAVYEYSHLQIIVFSMMIGGMVAIISRNGGMAGVVKKLEVYAKTPRSAQFITWLLGIAIFFDDYTNTLIVGNTMRATTDRFKISREKLAYIVDSTAAPIAALAFVTTWIGYELGQIEEGMKTLHLATTPSAYTIFLASLKYSFYPVFTLIFMLLLIFTKRDFGAMYKAEQRARTTGQVAPKKSKNKEHDDKKKEMEELAPIKGIPLRWYNAVIPVSLVIFVTLYALVFTGMESSYAKIQAIQDIGIGTWANIWEHLNLLGEQGRLGILVANADSYIALLWASFAGLAAAILMTLTQRIMDVEETVESMMMGFGVMLPAIIILILAWTLATLTGALGTAPFLTNILTGAINPYFLPVLVFVLAGAISFSTGSSWSTMAILYPIAIPLTWAICQAEQLETAIAWEILYNVIATVLAASVAGDHCSPISDTTILSSLSTNCNHIEHVRTQMPYALTVAAISLLFGFLSTWLGLPYIVSLLLGVGLLFGVIQVFGKRVVNT